MTRSFSLPPIIERELRMTSRLGSTYWSRVGAGGIGAALFLWLMAMQLAALPTASAGLIAFRILAGVSALNVVFTVLRLSSAAFAREKREDTLGLLFLTPLRPRDLAFGKLVSTSLLAFYQFVAVIPMLALPLLAGGVAFGDFLLFVLALANLVFLVATIGLYVSARAWDEKRASTIATLLVLALTVVLPGFLPWLATTMPGQPFLTAMAVSPIYPISVALGGGGSSAALGFSLLLTQIMAWLFFAATCRVLPSCWQNRPAARELSRHTPPRPGAEASAPPASTAVKKGRSVRRPFDALHRAQLLDRNPILWLTSRWRIDPATLWIFGLMGLILVVVVLGNSPWQVLVKPDFVLYASIFVNLAFKTHVLIQASAALSRDRGEDTLELLLATPITPRQLIEGHVQTLREPLRRWVWLALGVEVAWFALALVAYVPGSGGETWILVAFAVAVVGFLIPDLYAVGWTALRQGVISKDTRNAQGNAGLHVLLLPWLVLVTVLTLLVLSNVSFEPWWALAPYVMASAAADWWFLRRSRRLLETDMVLWAHRRAAGELEHYDSWRRWGRMLGRWWR